MVLDGIQKFCNLIRSAVIPKTFKHLNDLEYGDWSHDEKINGPFMIQWLRYIRKVKKQLILDWKSFSSAYPG